MITFIVAGCDFVYGVRRSAPITTEPDITCVEDVIKSAPGVDRVEHKQVEGGRPLTWTGIQAPTIVQNFFYTGPNDLSVVLQYTKDYDGRLSFWQSVLGLNQKPPQEQITASRPVMLFIERGLASKCGLVSLSSQVTEWCRGVQCPPLQ